MNACIPTDTQYIHTYIGILVHVYDTYRSIKNKTCVEKHPQFCTDAFIYL